MYNRLYSFLKDCNILSNSQSGFCLLKVKVQLMQLIKLQISYMGKFTELLTFDISIIKKKVEAQ